MPLKSRDQSSIAQATAQEDGVMIDKADCFNAERMYEILFEQAGAALYLHDLDGIILSVNAAACEQTGYSKEELLAMQIFDLHPEGAPDKEKIVTAWKSWSAGERINMSTEHQKKDGTIYPVELSISVICYAERNFILATAIDFSHWKSTEQSLRESEASERKRIENSLKVTQAAIENSLNGFDVVGENGLFLYVNKAYVKMWGYDSADEIIGTSPVNHCQDPAVVEKIITNLRKNGEYEFEFKAKRKDGSVFDVLMYARLAHDQDGNEIYSGTSIDITEKKLLEEELQQAQKLESIGNLAGGIAHEFNNILSIIMGNNELVMEELPPGSVASESSEEIRIASLRARDVVKQLLTFSRQDRVKKRIFDAREVIGESIKLLRATLPKTIAIETDLAETVHPIYGSETQLSQILINLGKNSADAIVTGIGTISVSLHNCDVEHENGSHYQVCLKISDTGIGMSKEVCKRIFDPYFTTKEVGKGTGIGLSVVHGIVESHGGTIDVDSRPQHGTTFTILLPAAENTSTEHSRHSTSVARGKEHLLLIDDEESICRISERMLQSLGYKITTCNDPIAALDLFRKNPGEFDCVISDMSMPGMTGEKLLTEMLEIRNDIPTILCTGYSETLSSRETYQLGIKEYILKPVDKQKMAAAVRRVLENSSNV